MGPGFKSVFAGWGSRGRMDEGTSLSPCRTCRASPWSHTPLLWIFLSKPGAFPGCECLEMLPGISKSRILSTVVPLLLFQQQPGDDEENFCGLLRKGMVWVLPALPRAELTVPRGAQSCCAADAEDVLSPLLCWGWGLLQRAAFWAL